MKYHLKQCVWEITLACCFSCKYCGSAGGHARENELTTEESFIVADQLRDLGCRRVSMIGGEVFMRRDWKEIVSRLIENGIVVNIITNGFLFTDALLADLKSLGIESVAVSLDGPKEVHDRYRQEGSYERALRAIRALHGAGIPVSVISTLNAENAKQLPELYETLKDSGIFAWQLQACSPMGNAANGGVDIAFDPREVITFVREYMKKAPFLLGVADNIGYFTPEERAIRGHKEFAGCGAGLCSVGIDSKGNVSGCESMRDPLFIEGNLREKSLAEIWYSPDSFKYNRNFDESMLQGKCADCPEGPYCAGGCRSYNFFTSGSLYESRYCARGE